MVHITILPRGPWDPVSRATTGLAKLEKEKKKKRVREGEVKCQERNKTSQHVTLSHWLHSPLQPGHLLHVLCELSDICECNRRRVCKNI